MTTSSPPSAFDCLARPLQKWIWRHHWQQLRRFQEQAIRAILQGGDVIIAAATAGGKTEAAFLPLFTRMLEKNHTDKGFRAVYVSPLKALINDQFRRLEELCAETEIPVFRWHGDVSQTMKKRARQQPGGVLLITPESLEALLIRRGTEIPTLFSLTEAFVIDELHSFIGTERGIQLQSILTRIEARTARTIDRIGLSATLGNMDLAATALRPDAADQVNTIVSSAGGSEFLLQLRGYVITAQSDNKSGAPDDKVAGSCDDAIARHLFKNLRGSQNLVFAGSRARVEEFADRLRQLSTQAKVAHEFFPHHGSLSKEQREAVEARLREDRLPTTAICTATLELGIDIGAIASIAQIGAPFSVSALRQRLGRSGRRDNCGTLRAYVQERALTPKSSLLDRLRVELVQTIAAINLLLENWCEPPIMDRLHLSTLAHQILAVICERGGSSAAELFSLLCVKGPFRNVDQALFIKVLRAIGSETAALIEQSSDGTLLPGRNGERESAHYQFYAVFETAEEYRLIAGSKTLGTLSMEYLISEGAMIIFAGRRWRIQRIDVEAKVVMVAAAKGGKPHFISNGWGDLDDRIPQEMLRIYQRTAIPDYFNPPAHRLLMEAFACWEAEKSVQQGMVISGKETMLLTWLGTRKTETLMLALKFIGLEASIVCPFAISVCETSKNSLCKALQRLQQQPPSQAQLAETIKTPRIGKFDRYLDDALCRRGFIADHIQPAALPEMIAAILQREQQR